MHVVPMCPTQQCYPDENYTHEVHYCLFPMHCPKNIEILPVVSVASVVLRMPEPQDLCRTSEIGEV